MYTYHAHIEALSAHMIHINLNMISYTHVEHSPTHTIGNMTVHKPTKLHHSRLWFYTHKAQT